MTTHFLTFHISFGGKGNINTATAVKVVKICPILFDHEVKAGEVCYTIVQ